MSYNVVSKEQFLNAILKIITNYLFSKEFNEDKNLKTLEYRTHFPKKIPPVTKILPKRAARRIDEKSDIFGGVLSIK